LDVVALPLQHFTDVQDYVRQALRRTPEVSDTDVIAKIGMKYPLMGNGVGFFLGVAARQRQGNKRVICQCWTVLIV
jgi:hypothetical protein